MAEKRRRDGGVGACKRGGSARRCRARDRVAVRPSRRATAARFRRNRHPAALAIAPALRYRAPVRVLGVILAIAASTGTVACVRGMFTARRPTDLGYALAAPLALVVAVLGVVLTLVPDAL